MENSYSVQDKFQSIRRLFFGKWPPNFLPDPARHSHNGAYPLKTKFRWKRSILPSLERDFRLTKSPLFLLPDIIPKHSQVFKAALSIHADDLRQRGIHLESRGGKIDLLRGNLLPMTREDINSLYRYLSSYYFPFLLIVPENIQCNVPSIVKPSIWRSWNDSNIHIYATREFYPFSKTLNHKRDFSFLTNSYFSTSLFPILANRSNVIST